MKTILILLMVILWSIMSYGQVIPDNATEMDRYELHFWKLVSGQITVDPSRVFTDGDTLNVGWGQTDSTSGGIPTTPPTILQVTGEEVVEFVDNVDAIWDADTAKAAVYTAVSFTRGPWTAYIRAIDDIPETGATLYSNWCEQGVDIYIESPLANPVIIYIRVK